MNSVILDKLSKFGKAIYCLFQKSGLNKVIIKIHGGFSKLWQKSVIVSTLKKENGENKGLLHKTMYLPVSFMEFLNEKVGRWLSDKKEKSFFLDLARAFMNSVLALNTKFLGCFLLSNVVVRSVLNLSFFKSKYCYCNSRLGVFAFKL